MCSFIKQVRVLWYWQDKSFKLRPKYIKKYQHISLHTKNKNTLQHLKFGKLKIGIRKIGCSMSWTRYTIWFSFNSLIWSLQIFMVIFLIITLFHWTIWQSSKGSCGFENVGKIGVFELSSSSSRGQFSLVSGLCHPGISFWL